MIEAVGRVLAYLALAGFLVWLARLNVAAVVMTHGWAIIWLLLVAAFVGVVFGFRRLARND